jgi:hypothetical protein
MFDRITPDGAAWADAGGGITMDGTRVVADERIHPIGYGPSATTIGATRAARAAVRDIRALLAPAGAAD